MSHKNLSIASDLAIVYVTFPSQEMARDVCHRAVELRHAACANILPPHTSIYHWKNKVDTSSEVSAILKTSRAKVDALADFFKGQHPYENPCFIEWAPGFALTDFAAWIREETSL